MSFVNSERLHINMLMGTVSTLNAMNNTKAPPNVSGSRLTL